MSGSATSWVRLLLGAQIEILFADAARPATPPSPLLISARDCGWDLFTGRASPRVSPRMSDVPGGQAGRASGPTASSPGTHTDAHPPDTLVQASPTAASPAESGQLVQPAGLSAARVFSARQALSGPGRVPCWAPSVVVILGFLFPSPLPLLPHRVLRVFSCSHVGVPPLCLSLSPKAPKI